MVGEMCRSCWVANGLGYGRCVPTPESGLSFFGSDISNGVVDQGSWSAINSPNTMDRVNCTSHYKDIWGISNTGSDANSTLRWSTSKLPAHTGLYIVLNVYKIDISMSTTAAGARKSQNVYVNTGDGNWYTVELMNKRSGDSKTPGSNICGGEGNEMIYAFTYSLPKHTGDKYQLEVTSEGGGIYIRQLQVYLGNCDACAKYQLNYEVSWLPRYVYNSSSSSGLDLWVQFN